MSKFSHGVGGKAAAAAAREVDQHAAHAASDRAALLARVQHLEREVAFRCRENRILAATVQMLSKLPKSA